MFEIDEKFMKDLKKFFYTRQETIIAHNQEYNSAESECIMLHEKFMEHLPDENSKQIFKELDAANTIAEELACNAYYSQGFRDGFLMVIKTLFTSI